MRTEADFLGEKHIADKALYGIHSVRAKDNFPDNTPFNKAWYQAIGTVKQACYLTVMEFKKAVIHHYPDKQQKLNLPDDNVLEQLIASAIEVGQGEHFEHFIVPAIQGGAGTSINMNVNEIITNATLQKLGDAPGHYKKVDPIEQANIYQSTNDVIPTALKVAVMQLLNKLETHINSVREGLEKLENTHRNTLRTGYTQMQQAVPSSYGHLFGGFNEALSRDWWRVSKSFERIKSVNLGGGATGSGTAIPRFFIIEVVNELKKLTGLPVTQSENLMETTSNLDSLVEVHGILKAHAVNLEKMMNDFRLLASDLNNSEEFKLQPLQTGSSIMPGKVNPVIPEFVISAAHQIYANDGLISSLSGQGALELNAYLPIIGHSLLNTLDLLIAANKTVAENLLPGIKVDDKKSTAALYSSPSVCTALIPAIGYHKSGELAKYMKSNSCSVFDANKKLKLIAAEQLTKMMQPGSLLQKGFSLKDI